MVLLPFRYGKINESVLITNEAGQYYSLNTDSFSKFVDQPEALPQHIKNDLVSKFFLSEEKDLEFALDETAIKLRTKKAFLQSFTELHIIVLTYACNSQCTYCHASSSIDESKENFLSIAIARKICECIIQSPAPSLKIEFQGGEPTLNFPVLMFVVDYLERLNKSYGKSLSFVVCTNLLFLPEEQLAFYKKHAVLISTSLDGPPSIHNENRKSIGSTPNYDLVVDNYRKICLEYDPHSVSALLTVSRASLSQLKACVDEYVDLGLSSIFIRQLNPYGMAEQELETLGYSLEEFLSSYEEVLDYIISLNKKGVFIREEFASLFLQKILTPYSSGFVDIQSPPGTVISCAVYDADGSVYPSDEARMLSRTGDTAFYLGSVLCDSYTEIFLGNKATELVRYNIVESSPSCFGCPYIPYCGIDPVRNYQELKLGLHKQSCKKYHFVLSLLCKKILQDPDCEKVFYSWLTGISGKGSSL